MGIDLGGVQMLMPEQLLKRAYVHSVLQHQRRRSVTQLVGGILACVKTGAQKALLDHVVDRFPADAGFAV